MTCQHHPHLVVKVLKLVVAVPNNEHAALRHLHLYKVDRRLAPVVAHIVVAHDAHEIWASILLRSAHDGSKRLDQRVHCKEQSLFPIAINE